MFFEQALPFSPLCLAKTVPSAQSGSLPCAHSSASKLLFIPQSPKCTIPSPASCAAMTLFFSLQLTHVLFSAQIPSPGLHKLWVDLDLWGFNTEMLSIPLLFKY